MEIMGYVAALFIGISLGIIGGGGSILTVPVFVYLFGISPLMATSYSLFVVGSTSLIGTINSYRKGFVDMHTAFLFGISSIITVYITRKLVIPIIPEHLAIGNIHFTFSVLTMVLFALLMLGAAVSMITSRKVVNNDSIKRKKSIWILLLYGMGIGLVTGFLGAGGGFLLIPVLVIFLRLPMPKAVGTSLLIIALNSLVGFIGDSGLYDTNWFLLITISLIAIVGVVTGGLLGEKIKGENLKKGFGWFVLGMGVYVLIKEIFIG
ncbi:MAG: sulfite exporter TauE/SafE family protein [Ginsengibacter sp.]